MLLPDTSGEEGDEEDPRLEITRPLLEYMKIKELAYDLSDREILGRDVFIRTPSEDYSELAKSDYAAIEVNIFQLIDAFQRIVDRKIQQTQLRFRLEEWSINEKIEQITERLQERQPLHFRELFSRNMGLSELVATFLAVLELVHRGRIRVFQPDFQSDILLSAPGEERRIS
jgi:segregation and condensation protein A